MLNNQVFYHGIIRKAVVSFGSLFSDVYVERKQGDSVEGNTIQKLHVPIAYAPKEKWLVRIEQDPTLENNTYVSLPRLSFEITGYSYDSARKLNKMNKIACNDGTSSTTTYTPVPYNLDISLYVLTKTQEDGLQIIEQILPTFTPEYTLSVNAIPEMHIVQDMPIILNSVSVSDEYDGDFATRRFVTHTLTFTVKLNLYGYVTNSKPIYNANANVGFQQGIDVQTQYSAFGDPLTGEITDGWVDEL